MSLYISLLLDNGALFVSGQFHAMEVGQTAVTLDFFADQSKIQYYEVVMFYVGNYLNFL